MMLRIVSGPAAAQPPRRESRAGSKLGWPSMSWNKVSLPEVSVQRSRAIMASAAPASNVGSVTRQAPAASETRSESVVPATWKNGRQLK
jgi:hypothetical protein